jgi:hypothetical protein
VFGGAAVNLTIRSGTNDFHGSVLNYLRDDAINSKNYFAATKAPYNSNQFGATLGGPIIKNRAFFFGDYQGLRLDQGRTVILPCPPRSCGRIHSREASGGSGDAPLASPSIICINQLEGRTVSRVGAGVSSPPQGAVR